MYMSVLDQQVRANANLIFADIGSGGGGGGGASTFVTANVSTLTVSSITGAGGQPVEFTGGAVFPTAVEISSITSSNPAGTVIQNGLNFAPGASAVFDPSPVPGATIEWTGGDGEVTGLSTINGQPWNAASVAPSLSTVLAGAVYVGDAQQALAVNAISTVTGKYYWAGAQILDLSLTPGAPTQGDSLSFNCGQEAGESYLQTVDTVAASTIRGRNGTVGFSMNGLIEATSSYTFFRAKMNSGATVSTFVTLSGNAWLTPVD